jgi:hypothetical protein
MISNRVFRRNTFENYYRTISTAFLSVEDVMLFEKVRMEKDPARSSWPMPGQ